MQPPITETPLQPIVNGSFNHELSNEEMLKFDFETKKQMAWNIIVSQGFAHSFRNIDHSVFTPIPSKYTHDMLVPESIDNVLETLRTEYQQRHKQLLRLTDSFYYQQGQEIYKQQKALGFGGFLTMDFRKMGGYIVAGGSWNEYEHFKVYDAVKSLQALVPKFYMRNNPNNGMSKHIWTTTGEYLTMTFNYLDTEFKDRVMNFYKTQWQPIGRSIKADSIRYELQDLGNNAFSLELIYWWD